jgi:hypothetical protein
MFVAMIQYIFTKGVIVAGPSRIRGNLSQGRKDKPGIWYK